MSMFTVLKEQIQHFYLITRLSLFEMKSNNSSNYLGMLWEIINPLIQIAIYWFVFGFGLLKNRGDIDGTPFLPWLIGGIVVWFFVNSATTEASKSIYTRLTLMAKMNFPKSVIPSFVIFSRVYSHLMFVVVVIIILAILGYYPTIYMIQLPYYLAAVIILLFGFSLITSTLTTVVRDVQQMVISMMRMLFYLTPILWLLDAEEHPLIVQLMKLNPLYYIVEGYRATLLGQSWYFVQNWQYTLYFWFIVIVFLMIGSALHLKFRDRFVDLK